MFNRTATVWTLVLLFVLAATAAGTTATVGKFSVPFLVTIRPDCLCSCCSLCAHCSVTDLKYPNCYTPWPAALWGTASVPSHARQFQWVALLVFGLVTPSSLTGTHSAEHMSKHEQYIDYCISKSKSRRFAVTLVVWLVLLQIQLATARPEFKNRDLLDCAKCYFSLLSRRAPVYGLAIV